MWPVLGLTASRRVAQSHHVRFGSRGGTHAHSRVCPTFSCEQTFTRQACTSEMCHFRTSSRVRRYSSKANSPCSCRTRQIFSPWCLRRFNSGLICSSPPSWRAACPPTQARGCRRDRYPSTGVSCHWRRGRAWRTCPLDDSLYLIISPPESLRRLASRPEGEPAAEEIGALSLPARRPVLVSTIHSSFSTCHHALRPHL
jgi:hypothetical protein